VTVAAVPATKLSTLTGAFTLDDGTTQRLAGPGPTATDVPQA
jgi:hypothetical protein